MEHLKLEHINLICQLFEEYSKKSVFKINEYADVSIMSKKLSEMVEEKNEDGVKQLNLTEIVYIINMLKISSSRYYTPVENFKPIAVLYEILILVGQELQKESEESKKQLETIQEENLDVEEIPKE